MGVLSWWRERNAWSRVKADGRDLVREVRQILKKQPQRVREPVVAELNFAVGEGQRTLADHDLDSSRRAVDALGELVDQHLAFARKSTIREYAESILIAVAIACVLRAFVVEAFQIPSGSMIPTLESATTSSSRSSPMASRFPSPTRRSSSGAILHGAMSSSSSTPGI